MFKGKWLLNLTLLTLKGKLPPSQFLAWIIARFRQKPLRLSLYNIQFDIKDHTHWGIITDIFINEIYTPEGFEIKPGDVVMDVGAHKGTFIAYSAVKKAGAIIAFEPMPENFANLTEMINNNQIKNVSMFQKGVSAETGETKLFLSSVSSRHTITVSTPQSLKEYPSTFIVIETVSLQDCIGILEKIDFMKMDCEGAEIDIILKAQHQTISKIQKLSIEIHQHVNSEQIQQLINHLKVVFPFIKTVQDNNSHYGYIYAKQ